MKRQFIISSMLALGMGIAQAQTQPMQSAPMQGGSNDPRQMQQPGATAPASAAQGMGAGATDQAAAQSFKGCLNGSAGSWTLTSDKGKSMNLSGTDNQLSPYQGQEVRIQGVQSSDGSITISSIDKVSETCANQAASNTGAQSSNTSQSSTSSTTSQSATATTPSSSDNMSQSTQAPATSTTPDNSNAAAGQNSTTTGSAAATTPPVTNQTPDNTVGSGQSAQPSAQSAPSSDQGVRKYSDMDQNAGNNAGNNAGSKLPQTASPLPLLGLLGLGSLVTGIVSRHKK